MTISAGVRGVLPVEYGRPGRTINVRTGENHRIAAPRRPPSGASQDVAEPDDLGEHAGDQGRDELGHDGRNVECRRDAPERPIVDERLAHGHLCHVVYRDGRIGDELLHDEAGDGDDRQPGWRERDERVAECR